MTDNKVELVNCIRLHCILYTTNKIGDRLWFWSRFKCQFKWYTNSLYCQYIHYSCICCELNNRRLLSIQNQANGTLPKATILVTALWCCDRSIEDAKYPPHHLQWVTLYIYTQRWAIRIDLINPQERKRGIIKWAETNFGSSSASSLPILILWERWFKIFGPTTKTDSFRYLNNPKMYCSKWNYSRTRVHSFLSHIRWQSSRLN